MPRIERAECLECLTCMAVCPQDVFEDDPANGCVDVACPESCIDCGLCIDNCPTGALSK